MNNIEFLLYIGDSDEFFTNGKIYEVINDYSDGDDLELEVIDDTDTYHLVTSEDGWIYEHFKLIEGEN